jgi:hypothetical protein
MGRKPILGPGNAKGKKQWKRATKSSVKLMKSVAESVLNRELETKYVADQYQNISFNSIINAYSTEAYACLPPVGVSSGAMQTYQRVGNEIMPLKLNVKMAVAIAAVARSCALRVDVYVLTRKDTKYLPTLLTRTDQPKMYNTGGGATGTIGYNGQMTIPQLRYNLNEFSVIKHKTFILAGNVGLPNGDTTPGNAGNLLPGCVKQLSMDIPCPKTLKYDEQTATAATYPYNFAPFILIGYSKVDGSPADVGLQSVVASWTVQMTFKDA